MNAFLIVPRTDGRHPAVLFLHGSGGNREDLLLPALELAARGFVTMTISQPNDARRSGRSSSTPGARSTCSPHAGTSTRHARAGRLLARRTDRGDPRRRRPRLKAIGIVAGRGSATPLTGSARRTPISSSRPGTKDEVVPHGQLVALIRAAPDHPLVRWYATGHGMNRRSFDDQVAWLVREIGFRPHGDH